MNPTILGAIGPGFRTQVPTLDPINPKCHILKLKLVLGFRGPGFRTQVPTLGPKP